MEVIVLLLQKKQCTKAGVSPGDRYSGIYTLIDNSLQKNDPLELDIQGAINLVNQQLENDEPTLTGAAHNGGLGNDENRNVKTEHFVVISGRGIDQRGAYFQYYENNGRTKGNKFYLSNSENTLLSTYDPSLQVSEVRPNN